MMIKICQILPPDKFPFGQVGVLHRIHLILKPQNEARCLIWWWGGFVVTTNIVFTASIFDEIGVILESSKTNQILDTWKLQIFYLPKENSFHALISKN